MILSDPMKHLLWSIAIAGAVLVSPVPWNATWAIDHHKNRVLFILNKALKNIVLKLDPEIIPRGGLDCEIQLTKQPTLIGTSPTDTVHVKWVLVCTAVQTDTILQYEFIITDPSIVTELPSSIGMSGFTIVWER